MANGGYKAFIDARNEAMLAGEDINAHLLDGAAYTRNLTTHEDEADLAAAILATTQAVSGGTGLVFDNGVDFPDFVFTAPTDADDATELVLSIDSGVAATSLVIINYDTAGGFPLPLSGADVTVVPGSKLWTG